MEIKGTFAAEVEAVGLKANTKSDGQQITVDTRIKLTPEDAEKKFGEAFHHVAFASMRKTVDPSEDGDATVIQFGYSTKKPPKWLRPSVHQIDLWGTLQTGQPDIRAIQAGENEEAVYVQVRFTFDALGAKVIGAIGDECGKVAKVKIKPCQIAAFQVRKPDDPKPEKKSPPTLVQKRHPALQAVV